ncbi:MAG: Hpt domain-containing protein [Eubacteriales bacterium]|nr:Hpt domain-containing protein [Eubacteriales bacterium]
MNAELRADLLRCETDLDGAMARFVNNEALYLLCLAKFLNDPTMDDLKSALAAPNWDAAFTAVHALKGLAGNMGFVPLFHASAEMVVLIRNGRQQEIGPCYLEVQRCYQRVSGVIRDHLECL